MCDECGCSEKNDDSTKSLEIGKNVMDANNAIASTISDFLAEKHVLCINIMGSPGAGKTTFIEGIAGFLGPESVAVIQGDLESDVDTKRLKKAGIDTHQINTHSGCHLNAQMINRALLEIGIAGKKYLIIENVGNLVCPAEILIGQHMNMVVSSTTEGSDKPKKYPVIFMNSELVAISKSDLAHAVGFDEDEYIQDITNINGKAKIIKTTSKDPESFRQAASFIEHKRAHLTGEAHQH